MQGTLLLIACIATVSGFASWYFLGLARRGEVAASRHGVITTGAVDLSPVITYSLGLIASIVVAVVAVLLVVLMRWRVRTR